ncbi:SDR family oxidoreductase [Leptolyngbya boryana CZ1]|jgi:short-subunit dehydrogenase|uniref:Short chain dehydrogenase n=2 Tax=Leptolyngbya boryana TaxID=1184 RepID=A0A1Z4JNT6_LEPBY|nr:MULTISPECIES: SDR family oxidoreductase [Leptolyngbya]BAY58313.1 short chain dehydrogenase [Leptolyngbya boryana NIES-2135]MBD1857514.1 SDR family oxidoreductase [Leptolyngbya sp. FACHB-1624]MBD2367989.1 SDR family oxidoreductase [Leptolyngbya sp. FACHB-161]MBD2374513.1 SDR family oxidoreductase [Leptolyngbya sp. FACHB-238]MBD2398935.1 SDR family oxidoreductase [Leptolyngbya sp. FACHB-239]
MTSSINRRALITGASSGIGQATALAFARSGIDLVLVSRSQSKLDAVAQEARSLGVDAQAYAIDLADVTTVRSRLEELISKAGTIDILVNNAGMAYTGTLGEMPLSDWQRVIDLNVTSVFQCVQAVLPGMRSRKRGTIINVASIAAHQTFPNWGAYCVSKFGVLALSKTLAAEERAHGIRVVTISPGSVNTAIWDTETVHADFDRAAMLTPDIVADAILQAATMNDRAVVEEMILMPNAGTF